MKRKMYTEEQIADAPRQTEVGTPVASAGSSWSVSRAGEAESPSLLGRQLQHWLGTGVPGDGGRHHGGLPRAVPTRCTVIELGCH